MKQALPKLKALLLFASIHVSFTQGALANSNELAVILGSPDPSMDFVNKLVQNRVSIPIDSSYDTDITTGLYSILAREGAENVVAIEVLSESGSTTEFNVLLALQKASAVAPVVFLPLRGGMGSNGHACRVMAKASNIAFVFPVGSDGSDTAVDLQTESHCFAKNILLVASMNQFTKTLTHFTDFGKGVRLAAPGIQIPVTLPGGRVISRSGVTPPGAFAAAQLSIFARSLPELKGADLIESFLKNETTELITLKGKVEGNRAIFSKN
jgi:hypothetical protein